MGYLVFTLFESGDLYLLLMNSKSTTGPAFHFHFNLIVVILYMNIQMQEPVKMA